MVNLYEHIEQLGKLHGYKNMTLLCKAAGVPRATMTELKKGRSKEISLQNAKKFAVLMSITIDEIYGEPSPNKDESEPRISDKELKFALFGGGEITDDVLQEVKNFAQFVKEREKQNDKD